MKKLWIKWLCWRGKAIDIKSNGIYPANILSNLSGNSFYIDNVECKSMEGFLQSLKHHDKTKQRQICSMRGRSAKHQTSNMWKVKQQAYWQGKTIDRQGEEFQQLLRRAYKAMFEQSVRFHDALLLSRGKKLYHSIGENDSYNTILTGKELCRILTEIRDNEDYKKVVSNQPELTCQRRRCPFRKLC